jgi:hypothetical protein
MMIVSFILNPLKVNSFSWRGLMTHDDDDERRRAVALHYWSASLNRAIPETTTTAFKS